MSKLSFRARALDASKPMPIYLSEELPDLPEYLSINRAVPQMPSGMEKEEESERHLQEAISTGKVIPTPEVFCLEELGELERLDRLYPPNHKPPKQYIHYQSYAYDNDAPDYDLDSEDEKWINAQVKKMDVPLTYDQFEEMMDRLEKGSGQQVITLKEAKLLLKEDDDLIMAVYDYWLNKRLRLQYPLIPAVKTEKTAGVGHTNNPYIAFRRRVEKMQTRKNRKNDEASYEKMLKLRRDLSRAVTILEMVKRREKMKKEHLHLTVEIFEKRYGMGDYSGQILTDVSSSSEKAACSATAPVSAPAPTPASVPSATSVAAIPGTSGVTPRPAYSPLYLNQHQWSTKVKIRPGQDDHSQKEKRSYKKRKHSRPLLPSARPSTSAGYAHSHPGDVVIDTVTSDEEEQGPVSAPPTASSLAVPPPAAAAAAAATAAATAAAAAASSAAFSEEDDPELDGEFTFRRKRNCSYLAPSLSSRLEPAAVRSLSASAVRKQRFQLGSLSRPNPRCLGMVRHRVGRGGRLVIDRACTDDDDFWRSLDFTVLTGPRSTPADTPHYHPAPSSSPPPSPDVDVEDYIQNLPSGYHIDGVPVEGGASSSRPLTVHMVPSSSVRLVATPEVSAAGDTSHSPPPPPPAPVPPQFPRIGSAFALAPADTFSELVTNLISPYLVNSDGVLLTSADMAEWPDSEECAGADMAEAEPPPTPPPAGAAATGRPATAAAPPERGGWVCASAAGAPPPSSLVTLPGTGAPAGSHVLLADTPPALQLITDKAANTGASSQVTAEGVHVPSSTGHIKRLVRKASPMEVT